MVCLARRPCCGLVGRLPSVSPAVRVPGPGWRDRLLPLACAGLFAAGWFEAGTAWSADGTASSAKPTGVTLDTDPHLVGWLKFDETSGKTAADSSGKNHDGTLEGALSFTTNSVPGRSGTALRLGGGNDCVRLTGYKGVTGSGPRSIAMWIKTPASSGDLVRWGTAEHGRMWIFGHIRERLGVTPEGGYLYMKAFTRDDAWHHVAAVVQEASPPNLHDHVRLYRDGELAEIDDIGLLDLWPIETGDKLDVTIGRHFKGVLDDVRIYGRALAEEEVRALFKGQSARPLNASK